jgi:hypothetical protein
MARRSEIVGMKELERAFRELGKVPQTAATKSARAGGSIALKAAKANAPEDEGDLKRGLILKRERSRIKGKAVYQVTLDPAMNDVFVKVSKDGKRSYYPASQEYGFLTVDGGYVPGYRYLRRSADDNERQIEKKMLDEAGKEVDKALRKGR